MQEMGLIALGPRPGTSRRTQEHAVYPYLLRNLRSGWPNYIWGINITYIRLDKGWLYLVAVLDWFSRYVVAWKLDQTLEMPFVLSAIDQALVRATPAICNSDQGSHFTSEQYLERLRAKDIQISMDGKGRALDNIFMERLWRTVKYEQVYLHCYDSPRGAEGTVWLLRVLQSGAPASVAWLPHACRDLLRHSPTARTTKTRAPRKTGTFHTLKNFAHCLDKGVRYRSSSR